ncbi:unnamed protein product [Adineta ricciae]|uniref:F-box domain-containing protein n=1 Tax=Adineta ricciae TaxID=249248 RepID=A0A813P7F5_ADIRI|nr:unnamed protein product [Adineta ricciae]
MTNTSSKFEILPNELVIKIFDYLNTFDLFHSFYNLNIRFNSLIQSLKSLHLTLLENNQSSNDVYLLSPYIHTLILLGNIDIKLHRFRNIRRLILHYPTNDLLNQFHTVTLSHLEYLSIPDVLFGMSSVHQKIFSNTFPNLKSCYLFAFETIETILPWTQTPSLRILKIGFIDFHVYKALLSACPNLFSLQLKMFQSYLQLSCVKEHSHLKKLEIHSEITDWLYNDRLIDMFLGCVPNLEQLTIYRTVSVSKIPELITDYDWLASILPIRSLQLKSLNFCLHLEYHFESTQSINTETCRQLKDCFSNAHQNRYQSRFVVK